MKHILQILLFTGIFLFVGAVKAQAPNGINYQAVIRNNQNTLVSNQPVVIRVRILQSIPGGQPVYAERHNLTTDQFGLVNFVIGNGTILSPFNNLSFPNINWGNGPYFLELGLAVTTQVNPIVYMPYGTQQMVSVPYALYAKSSGNLVNQWSYGANAPSVASGNVGDYYLETTTGNVYTLISGSTGNTWVLISNITGPQGPAGAVGPQGIQGAAGPVGATGPAGIAGPQGLQGIQGPAGVNGTNGTNGLNAATLTTVEPAGANCATGGVKLEFGPDANLNGILDAGEIVPALTKYVCNGAVGPTGPVGATGPAGPTGPTGPSGALNAWSLTGNAGTNPATNFIGTTDAQDWVVRTNNIERGRIMSNGNVGIGTDNPTQRFVVNKDFGMGVDSSVVITNVGNVGIGNPNPLSKLEIGTSDNLNWASQISNAGGSGYGLLVKSASPLSNVPILEVQNNSSSPILSVRSNGNVGIGTVSPNSNMDVSGNYSISDNSDFMRFKIQMEGNCCNGADSTIPNTNIRIDAFDKTPNSGVQLRFFRETNTTGEKVITFYQGNGLNLPSARIRVGNTGDSFFQLDGGNFGIGTATPDQRFSVNGNASKIGGGTWATFSDERVKTDITPFVDGLDLLMKLKPVTYKYNEKSGYSDLNKTFVGFIAQDVEKVAPYMVSTYDDTEGPSGLKDKRQFDDNNE